MEVSGGDAGKYQFGLRASTGLDLPRLRPFDAERACQPVSLIAHGRRAGKWCSARPVEQKRSRSRDHVPPPQEIPPRETTLTHKQDSQRCSHRNHSASYNHVKVTVLHENLLF